MSGFSETVVSMFYRIAESGSLPVAWFRDVAPAHRERPLQQGLAHYLGLQVHPQESGQATQGWTLG
jgi:hypothetical protein